MLSFRRSTREIRALIFTSRNGAYRELMALMECRGIRVAERLLDAEAARYAESVRPEIIFIEAVQENPRHYQKHIVELEQRCPQAVIILLAASLPEEMWVTALRLGVKDFVRLPVQSRALFEVVDRWTNRQEQTVDRAVDVNRHDTNQHESMVGASEALLRIKTYMMRAGASDCTILITGETGTGKELAAEFIHQHSARRNKPFVCVNCAAIPDSLLESELFGHVRGAFTGADDGRDGLLASAEGGTVLLDEIGDMSLSAQAKILRVLEKKQVSRLGSTQQKQIDVRFVAATNQDLESMAERGSFRKDLFYRLNAARVELPPLRERREDIPLLVEFYRRRIGGNDVGRLSEDCMRRISRYNWPGNIRELKNVLENLFLHCTSGEVQAEDLPGRIRGAAGDEAPLSDDERERLVNALCTVHWNKSRAAEMLRWSRMTLYRKMAKYRIAKYPESHL